MASAASGSGSSGASGGSGSSGESSGGSGGGGSGGGGSGGGGSGGGGSGGGSGGGPSLESSGNCFLHGTLVTLADGPQSQAVLEPFMRGRSPDAYLFSPREAEEARIAALTAARRTPPDRGNGVGSNRNAEAPRVLGDRYGLSQGV